MRSVAASVVVLGPLLAVSLACGTGDTAGSAKGTPAERSRLEEEAHAAMVAELASIADSLDPVSNPWANEQRLQYFTSRPVPTDPTDRFKLQGIVANEFLNSGRSELAVQAFRQMLDTVEEYPQLAPDSYATTLRNLLGISYLRLGEQQNCLDNHSGGACILPINEQAIHQAQAGSAGAIEVYTEILAASPDNLEARWLLNIAYATLGRHPTGVPEAYRISIDELSGPDSAFPHFTNVAPMAGLAHVGLSGGGLTEDFDGDGDLDVLVSSWGLRDSLRYFENVGNGSFVDKTEAAGLIGLTGGLNLVHADYDNDGDFDVVVLRGAWLREVGRIPNSLLRNDGTGRFTDVTVSSGLYSRKPTQTAAWADFDRDGHLDLFIGNESGLEAPNRSELFRNNGDGTFSDVANEAGVAVVGYVKGVTWIDFDNDLDPDLFVSLLGAPNKLFENRDGHFTDVTAKAGVEKPYRSFPTWAWDFDNDGWEDLLVLSYEATLEDYVSFQLSGNQKADTPRLYRNRGDGSFEDVTLAANLDVPLKAMGSNFGDLDNDGWLDFYAGTGDPDLRMLVPNKMYRNTGTRFEDVTRPGGFGHLQKGHAVSFADIDNDGDQDVHAVMGGALSGDRFQNVLFQNPGNENHWLSLRLHGHDSNRAGAGARIAVTVVNSSDETRLIHRTVSSGGSFGGSSYRQSIGLGADVADVTLQIRWPSGTVQVFSNVVPDSFYLVDEVEGLVQSR
jgi:hypothetical protein